MVEDFITRGVNGILLAPRDDVALRAPVAEAVRQKIPVVIIDSNLQGAQPVSFVATDNFVGGQRRARHLATLLNPDFEKWLKEN